jgi:hypothetical protein
MFTYNPDSLVTLVDRTTLGGDEIVADGQRLVFKPGEIEKTVPREFVLWLYRTDKKRVWTTGGDFAHRYAVKDAPAWLIDHCGPEVADCSPIEVDNTRLEGWDTSGVPRDDRTRTLRVNIPVNEQPRGSQAGGSRVTAVR